MQKKIFSVFLALLVLFTSINFNNFVAYAADEMPEPYKYWAVSVSTYIETNGESFIIKHGNNLTPKPYLIQGYPFGVSAYVEVNSNATPPKEYMNFEDAKLLTYEEYWDKTTQDPENKDSDFRTFTHLSTTDEGGRSIPISNFNYLGGSKYSMNLDFPDKQTMIDCLEKQDLDGTTDGSRRQYFFYVTYILELHHEKFNPETGEWDIESKVEADLKMNEESPATFNYKDFDENIDTEYSVNMDASGSSSARPNATYTYDMGIRESDENVEYKNEKTSEKNKIILNGDVSPTGIYSKDYKGKKEATGTFRVDGTVTVKDDKDVSATAYADTNVGYEIINEKPTAIYKATDKATSSDKYLYAKRTILIKDQSLDPENHLMDSDFSLFDGTKKIANWTFKKDTVDGTWTVVSSTKLDEYIEDMSLNASSLENTLTFNKAGAYRLEQVVKDIRNHEIVTQKFDTRNSILNIRSTAAPPKADFEYRLNGKTTDYTYPNIEVSLLDKSTDENDDIVSWQWTKHNGTKYDGQNGATAVFTSEGTYNTSLKVTDFLGLSDSITKPIQVLPPIPKAEIVTNEDESLMKKNRRIIISSEESFAPPSDPIQWDKTKWKIEPLDGQSPLSIKISNSLSDSKKKAVVFKQTGKYKVTIDLENNYTQANPKHPRISLKTTSVTIDIKDDIKPEPKFTITGNAPNFKDNPTSTVAKVRNTSNSIDNDFLDVFPDTGLDDSNNFFGRGKNAFDLEIRKDKNEDGTFADNEVYGKYTTRSVDIPVTFKENEGSDYQAKLIIKETFGQPTIKEFVSEDDRVTNTLTKKFSINWIPFIEFKLPSWAYPDDEIDIKTTIKDERVDTTKVVWTVDKKNAEGTYTNLLIDSDTINKLLKDGGKIRFPESGYYKLTAEITDEKGQKSGHSEEIRIYPFPTAVISDNPAYRFDNTDIPSPFSAKQNRTYELSGQTSRINDYFGTGIHEIDHSKDYFEIIPLDGQTVESIKITNGLFNLNSEDSSIFKATNTKLDREMLFKSSGSYKVKYQVTNVYGKKSPMAEQIIYINEDQKPIVEFSLAEKNYRNPSKGNKADITAYSIKVSSPDRDTISLERLRYRFDSNNDGNFEDETWKNATLNKTDNFNWKFEVAESHVGKYQFELYAEESYGQPTIKRYVDQNGEDKRFNLVTKTTVVDNKAPTADFSMTKREKVDVVLAIDKWQLDQIGALKPQIENKLTQRLLDANIDANIKVIAEPSRKINVLEFYKRDGKNKLPPQEFKYLDQLIKKYHLENYLSVSSYPINDIKSHTAKFQSTDVIIPTGLYRDELSFFGGPWWDQMLPFDSVPQLDNYVKNGGGIILRRSLGEYYGSTIPITHFDETFNYTSFNGYRTIPVPQEKFRDWSHISTIEFEAKPSRTAWNGSYRKELYNKNTIFNGGFGHNILLGTDRFYIEGNSNQGTLLPMASNEPPNNIDFSQKNKYKIVYTNLMYPGDTRFITNKMDVFINGILVYSNTLDDDYHNRYILPTKNFWKNSGIGGSDYAGSSKNDYFQGDIYNFKITTGGTITNRGFDSYMPLLFNDNELYNHIPYSYNTGSWQGDSNKPKTNYSLVKNQSGEMMEYPFKLPENISTTWTNESHINFAPQAGTNIWYSSGNSNRMKDVFLASNKNLVYTAAFLDGSNKEFDEKVLLNSIFYAAKEKLGFKRYSSMLDPNFTDKNANKFFSVLSIGDLDSLKDPNESLSLLTKLIGNKINFSLLGTSSNKSQFDSFNVKNEGNGKYFDNSNIDKALNDYADYIINKVKAEAKPTSKYILVNEKMDYKVHYSDYENDPQMNIHNWKYDHDPYFFENSLGQIANSNVWLNGSIDVFDKTGKYLVEYRTKDNPVDSDDRFDEYRKYSTMPNGAMSLYVHRKPIAKIKTKIYKSGTNISANLISEGYDLDHQSELMKGIREWEWSYKEVGGTTWINGGNSTSFILNGSVTKDYLVKHRVQDIDGENGIGVWSDDNIILITAKSMPPVADFEVTSVYPLRTNISVTDFSYDPNGDNIVEYRWKLSKGTTVHLTPILSNNSGVTQAQVDTIAQSVKAKIDSLGNTAYGLWTLELQVRDSSGIWGNPLSTSEPTSRTILVVPNNSPPVINIKPTHVFVDGKNASDIDNISNSLNNFINWNSTVTDPDTDNKGFLYRWELEHHEGEKGILKSTSEISSKDKLTTKVYTTQYPFTNQSFESNNLLPGPYKVRLKVTDIPTYGEAKSISTEKNLYIVPKINAVPYVVSDKEEILCGDRVTLRVITDKVTTGISAEVLGQTIQLSEVRKNGDQYIWESPFIIPEIEDSSNIDIDFTVKTDYGSKDIFGSDGQTTRIKKLKETVYITALKLEDFRVTDLVKHSQYKDLYPLRRPDFTLDYIAGYYCTFAIDAKGNPERVFAKVSHDNTEITTLELKKIGSNGTVGIWEVKYFAPYNTPKGTIISFDLEASKGTTKYNYNDKESWDGATLEVKDTLLKDAAISRTN